MNLFKFLLPHFVQFLQRWTDRVSVKFGQKLADIFFLLCCEFWHFLCTLIVVIWSQNFAIFVTVLWSYWASICERSSSWDWFRFEVVIRYFLSQSWHDVIWVIIVVRVQIWGVFECDLVWRYAVVFVLFVPFWDVGICFILCNRQSKHYHNVSSIYFWIIHS